MACGEYGLGRMSETQEIINSILEYDLSLSSQPLKNLSAPDYLWTYKRADRSCKIY